MKRLLVTLLDDALPVMALGGADRVGLIEAAMTHMAAYQATTGSTVIDGPISWLQRHLRIGYLPAVELAAQLDLVGVWSPQATLPTSRVVAWLRWRVCPKVSRGGTAPDD